MIVEGRARIFGDDVNTDYIISSRRKRESIDEAMLVPYLLEGVDPAFAASVQADDVIVAGRNFGCGSAMEVAATVIRAAGIRVVVARSFARSFHRNAVNNGLVPIACDTAAFRDGDRLHITLDEGVVRVEAPARVVTADGAPLPGIVLDILGAGGLVPYLRARGRFTL